MEGTLAGAGDGLAVEQISSMGFDEDTAAAALNAADVQILARLPGPGLGAAWGCDLTEGYVHINADYRS